MPLFNEFNKKAEFLWIQTVVANIMTSNSEDNKKDNETIIKEKGHDMKESLEKNAEKVSTSITGKFGKQVRETIKAQSDKLEDI